MVDESNKICVGIVLLALLQMIDFLITYYGVNVLEVISEANPLQVFLFDMKFTHAIIIRAISIYLICKLLKYLKKLGVKQYRCVIITGLLANIYIMYLHYNWLSKYLG